MKKQFKNFTYVCHSLFAAIVSTFWEIAAIVSTAIASSAIASTAIASTAIVSYTRNLHFFRFLSSLRSNRYAMSINDLNIFWIYEPP